MLFIKKNKIIIYKKKHYYKIKKLITFNFNI